MAKELTKKQALFVAEYLTDLNATRAAIAAGYEFGEIPGRGWYVYFLVDPLIDHIFYVGKGKGRRMYAHALGADSTHGNITKNFRIRDIHSQGNKVREVVFEAYPRENDAYAIEEKLITALKHTGLTNRAKGVANPKTDAESMLGSIKNFDCWLVTTDHYTLGCARRAFGDLRKFYDRFVSELVGLARDGV